MYHVSAQDVDARMINIHYYYYYTYMYCLALVTSTVMRTFVKTLQSRLISVL